MRFLEDRRLYTDSHHRLARLREWRPCPNAPFPERADSSAGLLDATLNTRLHARRPHLVPLARFGIISSLR